MYCKNCGAKLNDQDNFCLKCAKGKSQDAFTIRYENSSYSADPSIVQKEPIDKLFCELAYIGTLFWLPLINRRKDNIARYCANQGLWILILSVIACWLIQLAGMIRDLFVGGVSNVLASGIYSFLFMIFIIFMLFLAFSGFKNAMAIHRGEKPQPILFFDEHTIIREKRDIS